MLIILSVILIFTSFFPVTIFAQDNAYSADFDHLFRLIPSS